MSSDTAMLQSPAPHTVPGIPPLVERLVTQFNASWVNEDSCEGFAAAGGDCVLFIAGDPVRFPEGLDVAVVLPELQKHFAQGFRIGVAEVKAEDALAKRYAATRRPALVFLRDGQYVANVSGMLDWDDYVREVGQALAMPTSRVPGIGIPVVAAGNDSSCH